jgi:hypothetical protein
MDSNLRKKSVLFVFGLAIVAGAVPAMGNSVFASVVSSTGCGNTSDTSTTSANVFVQSATTVAPLICPDGNGIFSGAAASALGTLGTLAETVSQGGPSTITGPFSVTSTATLTDTITFSCTGCGPGTLTGTLLATITGAVFTEFNPLGIATASYTSMITDTTSNTQFVATGELCPTLATGCTAAETNPSTGYSVSNSFTIVPGDVYTFLITMVSFASVPAGVNNETDVLASQNDPMTLTLPSGVDYFSQSGEFLAPEPSSWVLVGGGLVLGFGLFRRRMAR